MGQYSLVKDLYFARGWIRIAFAFLILSSVHAISQSANNEVPLLTDCSWAPSALTVPSNATPEFARLQSQLADPDIPVTMQLFYQMADASLGLPAAHAAPPYPPNPAQEQAAAVYNLRLQELVGQYQDILVVLLPQKRGQAQIESLFTADAKGFRASPMPPHVQDCLRMYTAELFPSLPFNSQWRLLLQGDYERIKSPSLTQYLQQLYENVENHAPRDGPREVFRGDCRFYRGGILRRIYEENPALGRSMIMDELTATNPRADIAALRVLPDETIPDLDPSLERRLSRLNTEAGSEESTVTLEILERYGTASLLAQVKRVYGEDDDWGRDQEPLFLSYFLRTDPEFAAQRVLRLVNEKRQGYDSVFSDIAEVRTSPDLGRIAAAYLDFPNRRVAASAAYIFKWMGNSDVALTLWKNLELWHQEWAIKNGPVPLEEQDYEDSIVDALLFGTGPCRSKLTVDRLRPLYIKSNSVDGNIDLSEWHEPIRIRVDVSSSSGPIFDVDHCNSGLDLEEFRTALSEFPVGASFELYRSGLPEPAVEEIKSLAGARGISILVYPGTVGP